MIDSKNQIKSLELMEDRTLVLLIIVLCIDVLLLLMRATLDTSIPPPSGDLSHREASDKMNCWLPRQSSEWSMGVLVVDPRLSTPSFTAIHQLSTIITE